MFINEENKILFDTNGIFFEKNNHSKDIKLKDSYLFNINQKF